MKRRLTAKENVCVASMLFGLFFGAGNLIFPVSMGQLAGHNVWAAVLGFLITGVGLPLLGVAALGISRCDGLFPLSRKVGKGYGLFFTCLLYLTIGPFFAIPRCATVSFTVGVEQLLPQGGHRLILFGFSVVFFAIALGFSLYPGQILTWVGKVLTPFFLVFLGILVGVALLHPTASIASVPPADSYAAHPLLTGFLAGYDTMDALAGLDRRLITFGLEQGDVHAENLTWQDGYPTFDVVRDGAVYAHVTLSVPGVHNVRNALAACAAAMCLSIPGDAAAAGLLAFHGAGRRFEKKGEFHGAMVYDDYAHHPHELQALLSTVKGLGYRRVICAFQPHTYSRTHELFRDFVEVLKLPDLTLLAEIFAARETNTLGISSADLAREIPGAIFCPTLEDVTAKLRDLAQPGDLILTVGAGDIFKAGEALLKE